MDQKFVTILTVTKRDGWQERALLQIQKQKLQSVLWIIVHEENFSGFTVGSSAVKLPILTMPAPPATRPSNLNASLNAGLRRCIGDYVIFYQDFIDLPKDCFKKLINVVNDRTFVTTLTRNPDGSLDGRSRSAGMVRSCDPAEWEANVAIAPLKAIKDLGGFDEEYDNGWSWDNVNLAERADILGYKFKIDETNQPQLLFHVKEPDLRPDLPLNGDFHARRMEDIWAGERPVKLDYL